MWEISKPSILQGITGRPSTCWSLLRHCHISPSKSSLRGEVIRCRVILQMALIVSRSRAASSKARDFAALSIRFLEDLVRPILGITIKSKEGVTVYGVNSETLARDEFKDYGKQGSVMSAVVQFTCRLARGDYFISLGIATRQGEDIVPHDRRYDATHLQVRSDGSFFGLIDLQFKLSTQKTDLS